jgi:hypothetical protein
MCVAVLSLAVVVAMSMAAPAQEDPGPEVLREQIQCYPYTVRIFGPSELMWKSRIEFSKDGAVVFEHSLDENVAVLTRCATVGDVDGDGRGELILESYSGGAHCCFSYLIFSLGDTPALMARFEAQDSGAMLKDDDGDGIIEFHSEDMAFAYFGAPFAASVRAPIVVVYDNGAFHLAEHFMRKPAPSEDEWKKRADGVRADWDNKEVMDMTFDSEEWGRVPPSLWRNMLDLIYSGNGELAWKFLDELWPGDKPGKDAFRKDFEAQLATSAYYDDVLKLNGWAPAEEEQSGALRTMRYTPGSAEEAVAWQGELRARLCELLHVSDLMETGASVPLGARVLATEEREGFRLDTLELRATPGRVFQAMLAVPAEASRPMPAVVAIHGHGGNRMTPFNPEEAMYHSFGSELARHGFVVISTDVGQHDVYEEGRTLMGERLWDLMRCVDYLRSLEEVDPARIGCAGLSLGGEMAMWLGAMDPRVAATVSAGFLTFMDQMEQNHCMCWKFEGLRELVDFPDIYAMIAPRPLQCQNGLQEPPTQFTPELARKALLEIVPAYRDTGAPGNLELLVHQGGHEIALESLVAFLKKHLNHAE